LAKRVPGTKNPKTLDVYVKNALQSFFLYQSVNHSALFAASRTRYYCSGDELKIECLILSSPSNVKYLNCLRRVFHTQKTETAFVFSKVAAAEIMRIVKRSLVKKQGI
jgi:hypothetical protein